MSYQVKPIGKVQTNEEGFAIKINEEYIPGLKALDGFGYVNVVWWFSECDNEAARSELEFESPYKGAPAVMGVFATRSPERPNPIALTACEVLNIDYENGIITIPFIDAENDTPVLDIKPYTPSLDRVENPVVPQWCNTWPKSVESSGDFDWSEVFNF